MSNSERVKYFWDKKLDDDYYYPTDAELLAKSSHLLPDFNNIENGKKSIGIDLGTDACVGSIFDSSEHNDENCKLAEELNQQNQRIINIDNVAGCKCPIIPLPDPKKDGGRVTLPSFVFFDNNGVIRVGEAAKTQISKHPESVICTTKIFIGADASKQSVQKELKSLKYHTMIKDKMIGIIPVTPDGHVLPAISAQRMGAVLLEFISLYASKYLEKIGLGKEVKAAVVTVPAYFGLDRKRATKKACEIAQLPLLGIILEPTAAILHHLVSEQKYEYCANYLQGQKANLQKKKKKQSVTYVFDMGGGTFDVSIVDVGENFINVKAVDGDAHLGGENLTEILAKEIIKRMQSNFPNIDSTNRLLRGIATRYAEYCKIELSSKMQVSINIPFNGIDFNFEITRDQFTALIQNFLKKTNDIVERSLKLAKLQNIDVTTVLRVGGSTKVPEIQKIIDKYFPHAKQPCINFATAVAQGAGIYAAIKTNLLKKYPYSRKSHFADVIPHAIGTEIVGKKMSVIIPANSRIPCIATKVYTTVEDNQTTIPIHLYEGSSAYIVNNSYIEKVILEDIPPLPKGQAQIQVTIKIDANAVLHVTAVETRSNRTVKAVFDKTGGKFEAYERDGERVDKDNKDNNSGEEQLEEIKSIAKKTNFEKLLGVFTISIIVFSVFNYITQLLANYFVLENISDDKNIENNINKCAPQKSSNSKLLFDNFFTSTYTIIILTALTLSLGLTVFELKRINMWTEGRTLFNFTKNMLNLDANAKNELIAQTYENLSQQFGTKTDAMYGSDQKSNVSVNVTDEKQKQKNEKVVESLIKKRKTNQQIPTNESQKNKKKIVKNDSEEENTTTPQKVQHVYLLRYPGKYEHKT